MSSVDVLKEKSASVSEAYKDLTLCRDGEYLNYRKAFSDKLDDFRSFYSEVGPVAIECFLQDLLAVEREAENTYVKKIDDVWYDHEAFAVLGRQALERGDIVGALVLLRHSAEVSDEKPCVTRSWCLFEIENMQKGYLPDNPHFKNLHNDLFGFNPNDGSKLKNGKKEVSQIFESDERFMTAGGLFFKGGYLEEALVCYKLRLDKIRTPQDEVHSKLSDTYLALDEMERALYHQNVAELLERKGALELLGEIDNGSQRFRSDIGDCAATCLGMSKKEQSNGDIGLALRFARQAFEAAHKGIETADDPDLRDSYLSYLARAAEQYVDLVLVAGQNAKLINAQKSLLQLVPDLV